MKKCKGCGLNLEADKFYIDLKNKDGLFGKCKECIKEGTRLNRAANAYKYRLYDKARSKKESRRVALRGYSAAYKRKYPERVRANAIAERAIASGKIKREPCLLCGASETEAHHEDYSQPLEVVFLCRKHHALTGVARRSGVVRQPI